MKNEKDNEEKDLETLRREYRNMEVNRKTLAEESNSILRRQQQNLDKLRAENENLKTDVATLQARTTMKPLNSFEQSQLDKVTIEIERYSHLVDIEKSKISTNEEQISKLRQQIWNQRRNMGGTNAVAESHRNVEKQVRILENRLDQGIVKFNRILANNKKLREDIDNLRGERISFEGVYKKLEKGLQDRKRKMAQVIEQSNSAYEQRDKARMEIASIDQTSKKEQEHFDKQMEDLGRSLETEINAAADRRKHQHPNMTNSDEETKIAAEKAAKTHILIKEREQIARDREAKIQGYEDAFHKIEMATSISDVDELVKVFKEQDEQNFSLFTYVNEQTNDIEDLEGHVQALRSNEGIVQSSDSDAHYDERSKEIDSKVDVGVRQAANFDRKTAACQEVLVSVKDAIKILITRLDLDTSSIGDIYTNDSNLLQFMGIIEKRTNSILSNYHRCKTRVALHTVKDSNEAVIRQEAQNKKSLKTQGQNESTALNPPKFVDYSSDENSGDEGDGSRPLSIEELKAKTLNRINQPRKKQEQSLLITGRRGSVLTRRRTSMLSHVALSSKRSANLSANEAA